jgi:hypothetical protein
LVNPSSYVCFTAAVYTEFSLAVFISDAVLISAEHVAAAAPVYATAALATTVFTFSVLMTTFSTVTTLFTAVLLLSFFDVDFFVTFSFLLKLVIEGN